MAPVPMCIYTTTAVYKATHLADIYYKYYGIW